jgi:S1-C subfamily serine protease
VVIHEVVEGSTLERVIEPGSVLVSVMDRPVRDVNEFVELLRDTNLLMGPIATVVSPEGRRFNVVLRIESP